MVMAVLTWLIAIPLLGFVTGLRTFTAMMVLCWFAYRGHLPLDDTWASWAGHLITAIIFTVLANGEYIGDKLPQTPNRTAPGPLIARLVFGGLVGAILATGLDGSVVEGILLGVGGAVLGAFGGYLVRRELVYRFACKDWHIAVAEDILAVGCAVIAMGVVTG
ncbi:MAG: hypothetical protein JWM43_2875 [Acidobacteriaceae bacterium]|nr:hypothetical protein [Acidobacteriaceae bacterium]